MQCFNFGQFLPISTLQTFLVCVCDVKIFSLLSKLILNLIFFHFGFLDFDTRYFWKWTDFASYLQFLLFFVAFLTLMNFMFLESTFYVETVGFLAVFAEACLGIPQFYKNFQNKSTIGMR